MPKTAKVKRPLHIAVIHHKPKILGLLVKTAMIDSQDNDGRTALHYAVLNDDMESVRILVDNHANKTIKDNKGETPEDLSRGIIRFILTGSNPGNVLRYTCFGNRNRMCRPNGFNINLPRQANLSQTRK